MSKDVTLRQQEINILKHIFNKRSRVTIVGFFGCLSIAGYYSWPFIKGWYLLNIKYTPDIVAYDLYDRISYGFIASCCFISFLLIFFGILFYRGLYLLHKDIRKKSGIERPILIKGKSILYQGSRFFLFLDDPKIYYKEVDAHSFYNYQAGDHYHIVIGKHSKIHVDPFLNMPLI